MVRPAIIVLGPSGLDTARRVADALGAELHGLEGRISEADVVFAATTEHIASLFCAGQPVIGICAAGILIRAVAPCLWDKHAEPPVLAVAEDGSAVVPLLGGHHGANDLAHSIGGALGIAPSITTAGDLRFGVALDAPPAGWSLANPEDAKAVMARLIAGAPLRIEGKLSWLPFDVLPGRIPEIREQEAPQAKAWMAGTRPAMTQAGHESGRAITLTATEHSASGGPDRLVYHPKTLALGVGCERGCAPGELISLVEQSLGKAGLAPASVALVTSLDLKADEPAVHALASHLGVPARFFGAQRLDAETPRLKNPSETVRREVGCPGVAEGAALAAAGPEAALFVEKTRSQRATCAIARAPAPIKPEAVGRARGRLSVVGLGPGDAAWRSPEATRLLTEASDWVGYGLYLDLVRGLSSNKRLHRYTLGNEEARVRHALSLAGEGGNVALVCSGDAGIYAMAALVFEVLDSLPPHEPARRTEFVIAPGISAFQAAAARAGALIGHDFCAVSLSDLLTPWEVIEARVKAAADGDFVVAFYNPRSQNRQDHLARASAILSQKRPPQTPVVVASNLGRADERVDVHELGSFDPSAVDMLTVVLIGASTSRAFTTGDSHAWAYTPRGYAAKRKATE